MEVLVVVVIVGILVALALPSFNSSTQIERTLTEIQDLATDLRYARSEAIKEGTTVQVCIGDTSGCSTTATATDWGNGWAVVSSAAPTSPLRVHGAIFGTDTLSLVGDAAIGGTTVSGSQIQFSSDGLVAAAAGGLLFTAHTTPVSAAATHCLSVGITGQLQFLNGTTNKSLTVNNTAGTSASSMTQTCV